MRGLADHPWDTNSLTAKTELSTISLNLDQKLNSQRNALYPERRRERPEDAKQPIPAQHESDKVGYGANSGVSR
jgi:hypothetical protein